MPIRDSLKLTIAVTAAALGCALAPTANAQAEKGAALSDSEERALRPKDSFKECPECPEMVVLPAGEFTMGSPPGEAGRGINEGPLRKVTIARPFAVGKYEVTFAEWEACVAGDGCTGNPKPFDQRWGKGRRPVIYVSWHDAKEYAAWLSRETGKAYRLLSEAEWEYAARAGTTTRYAFGDMILNLAGKAADGTWLKRAQYGASRTAEVGSFPANGFGLHDLHGNVWEWVEDTWHPNYEGAPTDGSVWSGGDVSLRVMRGGAWNYHNPDFLRSAVRSRNRPGPGVRISNIGFRVARTL